MESEVIKAPNDIKSQSSTSSLKKLSSSRSFSMHRHHKSTQAKMMKRDTCIIDPEASRWLWKWDLFGGLLLVTVAIVTPFEAGFLEDVEGLVWFNNFVNLFFFTDCLMQFFLAFEKNTRFGPVWVFKRKAVFIHYVRGWFFIDLVSVIPYGFLLPGSPVGALKAIRMIRLTKLLKLVRGARLVRRWQAEIGFSYRHGALYMLLIIVLAIAHWLACVLGLIHRLQVDGSQKICDEVGFGGGISDDCDYSWLTVASRGERNSEEELSPWDSYLYSLHMAMSMLVHPHSNKPTRPGERLTFIILTLFAGFVWTQVISRSTAIRTSIDRNNLIYHQTMDDINALAKQYHLTWDTSLKLRKFFMKTRNTTQADTWRDLTRRMSPQLRRDTAREINRTWIKRIRFLAKCLNHVGFITDVSQAMHVRMYAERESFGELNEMYVMVEGLATRYGSMNLITPGQSWGEDHLILTHPKLLEDNVAVTMTFVEVQVLKKADFDTILLDHDGPREIMRREKYKYLLKRGIVLAAKDIKKKRRESQKTVEEKKAEEDSKVENTMTDSMLDSLEHRQIRRSVNNLDLDHKRASHIQMHVNRKKDDHKDNEPFASPFSQNNTEVRQVDLLTQQHLRIAQKQDEMELKLNIILSVLQKAFPDFSQEHIHDI